MFVGDKLTSQIIQRWRLQLLHYSLTIVHRKIQLWNIQTYPKYAKVSPLSSLKKNGEKVQMQRSKTGIQYTKHTDKCEKYSNEQMSSDCCDGIRRTPPS